MLNIPRAEVWERFFPFLNSVKLDEKTPPLLKWRGRERLSFLSNPEADDRQEYIISHYINFDF
jgi:hypothetical protein